MRAFRILAKWIVSERSLFKEADMHTVRQPAVAGMFYPADPRTLAEDVTAFLDAARPLVADMPPPKALIAPHAGYIYSGSTAALGYATLADARDVITRVVLLGPTHRMPVRGLALPGAAVFRTPLGDVGVEVPPELTAMAKVVTSPDVHRLEHSLEVHLPFLQLVLGAFTLVPLAVGEASASEVADVLDAVWGGPETLIVVSSDLSHYLDYESACEADSATIGRILELDGPIDPHWACGGRPVSGLIEAALRHRLKPTLVGACNSGDTAGDRHRVVGYATVAFHE